MTPKQLTEYQRYLEILSSNASIAETIAWEIEWEKRKAVEALKQQKIEIAKKYIQKGYSNEIIKDGTDFTDEEIDKLRNELNDKQ